MHAAKRFASCSLDLPVEESLTFPRGMYLHRRQSRLLLVITFYHRLLYAYDCSPSSIGWEQSDFGSKEKKTGGKGDGTFQGRKSIALGRSNPSQFAALHFCAAFHAAKG